MLFILILLGNVWIWKILSANIVIGILVILTSVVLIRSVENKKLSLVLGGLFIALTVFQVLTTARSSLTKLDNDQIRLKDMRLSEYPPKMLRAGYWLEVRKESIAVSRISENFFQAIDPNLYFFANHPRERVGYTEFEKFPYFALPFFLLGVIWAIRQKRYRMLLMFLGFPVFIVSVLGFKNPLGPFSLFPVFVFLIMQGRKILGRDSITPVFVVLYVLVFFQTIGYALH